jgi:two-component system LytT family sensor kinase
MKKNIKAWLVKYWIHILCWISFIFYETVMVGLIFGVYGDLASYTFHYSIHISFFYLNALFLLPWALLKNRYAFLRLPTVIITDVTGYILLSFAIDFLLTKLNLVNQTGDIYLNKEYILRTLYRCIYFLGFSVAYYLLINYLDQKKKTADLESQRLLNIIKEERLAIDLSKAENAFLRAQINPHFLFNTLDYIYHNIEIDSQKAAEAIIILAEIMRYSIDAIEDDGLVSIGEEIAQVESLLLLYQLRMNKELNFKLLIAEEVKQYRFIPLVLLTLLENIFKHGKLDDIKKMATLAIYRQDNMLVIRSDNFYNKLKKKEGTGQGLKNIHSRLQHIFGNYLVFKYGSKSDEEYFVEITVPMVDVRL